MNEATIGTYIKRFWWTLPLAFGLACGLSMCVTYNALVRHENGIEASTKDMEKGRRLTTPTGLSHSI